MLWRFIHTHSLESTLFVIPHCTLTVVHLFLDCDANSWGKCTILHQMWLLNNGIHINMYPIVRQCMVCKQCSGKLYMKQITLTHWGRVTHICVSKLTIIGSDNGLAPSRRQAIIWTNDGLFLIGPLGTNFSEIVIEIVTFSFTKMRLNVSSAKWRPRRLGLNVLSDHGH